MDFHDLVFYSGHHYRFECGVEVGGGAAKRAIRIQDSISGNEGSSVTIYDTEESDVLRADTHPLIGVQIPFSNYGLTIYHPSGVIQKITLHMFDKNVDIEYKL